MKKCPYCAEEVQDAAVKCKHCHADIPMQPVSVQTTTPEKKNGNTTQFFVKLTLWSCVGIVYLIFLATAPFVAAVILLLVIWLASPKSSGGLRRRFADWRKQKARIVFSVIAILISIPFQTIVSYPVPAIAITSDTGNQGTSMTYALTFTVADATRVTVNGQEYQPDANGVYTANESLDDAQNAFEIVASNEHKSARLAVNIEREMTVSEREAHDMVQRAFKDDPGSSTTGGQNGAYGTPDICDINSYVAGAVIQGYAKYPDEAKQSCTYATMTSLGDHEYKISGYVIAKNSFGVDGRIYYSVVLRYKGGATNDIDNWELVSGPTITE